MKTIYWTCRYERLTQPYDLWWGTSKNGVYMPAEYLNNQFWDWYNAWLTKVIDNIIPEENYIWEIAPWIPKLTRFIMCEYDENYVVPEELSRSLENVWARFNIDMLTVDEMITRIKANTNLQEVSAWKFLISNETEIMWEIIPAKYLTIE